MQGIGMDYSGREKGRLGLKDECVYAAYMTAVMMCLVLRG
jgi:hypothetical protein